MVSTRTHSHQTQNTMYRPNVINREVSTAVEGNTHRQLHMLDEKEQRLLYRQFSPSLLRTFLPVNQEKGRHKLVLCTVLGRILKTKFHSGYGCELW